MQLNYTTINHTARLDLGLSLNEYCLMDLIYNLSNAPKSRDSFGGWCYASKETLGEYLGISKQSIHAMLNRLEAKNYITKNEQKHLRVMDSWFDRVQLKHSKESLPIVKKVYPDSKESLPQTVKKVYTTRIYNKDIHNIGETEKVLETYKQHFKRNTPLSQKALATINSRIAACGVEMVATAVRKAAEDSDYYHTVKSGAPADLDWIIRTDEEVERLASINLDMV